MVRIWNTTCAYCEISNDASGCARHMRGRKYDTTEGNGGTIAVRLTPKSKNKPRTKSGAHDRKKKKTRGFGAGQTSCSAAETSNAA